MHRCLMLTKAILIFLTALIISTIAIAGFAPNLYPTKSHSSPYAKSTDEHWLSRFALSPNNKEIYALDGSKKILTIVDVASGKTLKTIPLPVLSNDEYFLNISFTPDGKKAYLSSGVKDVYIVDTIKQQIIGKVANKLQTKYNWADTGLAMSPDGKTLYATDTFGERKDSDAKAPRLHMINTQTDRVYQYIEKLKLDDWRWGWDDAHFTFNKDGSLLYFTDAHRGTVAILNTKTNELEDDAIDYHDDVASIAINPLNDKLYVMSQNGILYRTDLKTRQQIDKIDTGGKITPDFALTPDGYKLYAADKMSNSVLVVDMTDQFKVIKNILVDDTPQTVCMSLDGSKVYVGNARSNTISVIDVGIDQVIRTIRIDN